jgi:ComF family protein
LLSNNKNAQLHIELGLLYNKNTSPTLWIRYTNLEFIITHKILDFLKELLFPSFCLGCNKEGTYLCQDCLAILDISQYHYCLCNKNPLRLQNTSTGKCSRCKDKKLSGLYAALPYKEKFLTRKLIHQFKYEPYIKDLSKPLTEILEEHIILTGINQEVWQNSILIPIPLENTKLKSRGYNQSEELAKKLSAKLHIPLIANNLIKIKKTEPQMTLSAKKRQENVKDAFAIKNPTEIAGKKIFLVDDVYTTGSTMEECANVLRTQGAKSVWGIVIARDA